MFLRWGLNVFSGLQYIYTASIVVTNLLKHPDPTAVCNRPRQILKVVACFCAMPQVAKKREIWLDHVFFGVEDFKWGEQDSWRKYHSRCLGWFDVSICLFVVVRSFKLHHVFECLWLFGCQRMVPCKRNRCRIQVTVRRRSCWFWGHTCGTNPSDGLNTSSLKASPVPKPFRCRAKSRIRCSKSGKVFLLLHDRNRVTTLTGRVIPEREAACFSTSIQ